MSDDREVEWASVFATGDHSAAYRVRNTLQAAGIEAEVCPARQGNVLLVGGSWTAGPWHVLVANTDAERAADLAERWRRHFEEGAGTGSHPGSPAPDTPTGRGAPGAAADVPAAPPPLDPPAGGHH